VVAHAAAYLAGMEAGWTQSLERLAEELARSCVPEPDQRRVHK
jgi:hypothetical protein